jgi:nicotinamide phosphoribosyltransferase
MQILPILLSDSYKQFHWMMYPKGITKLYSNMTPRSYKHLKCEKAVFFGLQYYIKEYLINQWNENFFNRPLEEVLAQFKRFHKHFSFYDMPTDHIAKLHNLGYLPIKIKALPEGSLVNEKIPFFTITNTHDDFAWLVNFLETQMSTTIWDCCVNATIAYQYKKLLTEHANKTCNDTSFVQWQGHDFAQRGRSSTESTFNQAGHLLSFTGTDTIPSVFMLEEYYNADITKELIGSSVPATEHSVMTSYGKENELDSFERILNTFPSGIVSIVSDSFDLWEVCTTFVTKLKDKILSRDGKLVIRPDSGDPVDIVCGFETQNINGELYHVDDIVERWSGNYLVRADSKPIKTNSPEIKGVVELLWDVFGGTINSKGYKVLDSHIGVIYGDSISLQRADEICKRLERKGFSSNNVVFGIGSYTYNYNTRDSLGIAVKSTYCVVNGENRNIFKDPVTDDGLKKSARGLLKVEVVNDEYVLYDEVSIEQENRGELKTVYENGKLIVDHNLKDIRDRLEHKRLSW